MNSKPIIVSTDSCHNLQGWFSEKTGAALMQLSVLSRLIHHPEDFPQFAGKPDQRQQYMDQLIWTAVGKVYTVYMLCQGVDEIDRGHIRAIFEDGLDGWGRVKKDLSGETTF